MSDPLPQPVDEEPQPDEESQPVVKVKEEVLSGSNEENLELPPESSTGEAETDNIEYYTISETNPYFDIILSRTHVTRYDVALPTKIVPKLPSSKVPVVLKSHGKSWSMFYRGDKTCKIFDMSGWKKFAVDNELKVGDCCFFELLECSTTGIEFKVIIIKGNPSTFGEADGDSTETAIIIE